MPACQGPGRGRGPTWTDPLCDMGRGGLQTHLSLSCASTCQRGLIPKPATSPHAHLSPRCRHSCPGMTPLQWPRPRSLLLPLPLSLHTPSIPLLELHLRQQKWGPVSPLHALESNPPSHLGLQASTLWAQHLCPCPHPPAQRGLYLVLSTGPVTFFPHPHPAWRSLPQQGLVDRPPSGHSPCRLPFCPVSLPASNT